MSGGFEGVADTKNSWAPTYAMPNTSGIAAVG